MRDQIDKYVAKLIAARTAEAGGIGFAARDDSLITCGSRDFAELAGAVLSNVNSLGLVAARPSVPFADLLVSRAGPEENRIIPRDTETRTFLHDIPFLRRKDTGKDAAFKISGLLADRKGVIVEGLGIVATGAMTIEQAYINYSSVFHATFIKYLQDILADGFKLPGEAESFIAFRDKWLRPLSADGLAFRTGPLLDPADILAEIATVGRYTVECGLVDSFFGNISALAGNTLYISRTAASLDELAGCIDPVALDNSSTAGITASSELIVHRRIYEASDARVILHGHPRFSVVLSMLCEERGAGSTTAGRSAPGCATWKTPR